MRLQLFSYQINIKEQPEVNKKINLKKNNDFRASVQKIQKHKILVIGSFIMGLDSDKPGIGKQIAKAASNYRLDILNALFLTPLPGTTLWDQMNKNNRIAFNNYPRDWKYFTLTFPVGIYKKFSMDGIIQEMMVCNKDFYSIKKIGGRIIKSFWNRCSTIINFVANLSYWFNIRIDHKLYATLESRH